MPWPDFTELTFGCAYLRELEQQYASGGTFPLAPDFISQNEEKGYDVKVILEDATPLFIQLKRSYVLTRSNAKEVQDGTYPDPRIFRMSLYKKESYRQHKTLQLLESAGNEVQYVTSQTYSRKEFDDAFALCRIVSHAAAHFLPSEIDLPNETEDHHVSFKSEDSHGYIYSAQGKQFPRKVANFGAWAPRMRERRSSYEGNFRSLKHTVEIMSSDVSNFSPLARLIRKRPIEQQASILAYVTLGAQLTFVRKV